MKKFFSFLTAILASVTLASALEITVPATTLDLQNPTIVEEASWTGETAYYLDDDVLIVSGYEAYKSVAKQTWITFLSTGSSSSTWNALAPFKGSDYYTNKNYSTLQSNRYTAYLVTNCDSVWAYGCNNAATAKYLVMNVYEITGEVATINTESVEPTYSVSNEAAGKADVVLKQALDATKKYLVVTTGAGASNSRSYETAFFRHPDATPKTSWTVAGSSATVFGTAWDPTNKANDMKKQTDGSYKWEKTELELAAGSVDFKVCKDHAWDEAYPASNYNLAIAESGIYTITITFEPENSNKVSAVATKTGSLVVLPEVKFHGNFFGTWADTDPFTAAEDKLTAELTLSLTEGTYEFGCKFDGTWKANGATLTREAPATSLAEGSGNMKLVVDQAGEYVFTYTFLGEQLAVTYPKKGTPGAYTLTFNGTGTSSDASSEYTKDGNIFTDDCKAYVASVDTISKVYAARIIAENTSSLKFGTSSVKGYLEFTLATPVEVDSIIVNATQYGNNAAEVTVNGVKFDLTAGNKKPQDCKLVPNGIVSKITIAQTGSERIYLRYVTIYAKTTPTPPTPVDSMTVYFVNYLDWANVNAFVWPAEGNAYKEWPGEAAKKEAEKINEKDVYAYTFPASYVNVIFNNGTVQTTDQTWAAAKPYFVPGAANEQGKIEGAWYAKEDIPVPPTPATPVYNIAAVWTNWKLVELEVAQDKKTATYMVELPKGNYEFKIVRTLDTDTAWLTKENEGAYGLHRGWPGVAGVTSTANNNLAVQADENGVYLFTWTFENDSIGIEFPKVYPLNEIWGVDSETAVAAGTTYADNYAINIKSVFAGTLKENARTFGGVAFTHAIQVRNNAYPSADHPEGTEQSGSTSLIVTAKENVEIEMYYNRQTTSSETGAAALNDGKDIIVFDQAAPTTKMDGKFKVLWMQDDKKYVNAIKVLTLEKGHVYTISAKGTTAQLHGIRYVSDAEAPIVIPAKYYLTGDSALLADAVGDATLAWKANAIKSETDTFTLSLKANQEYKLKLIENGDWEGGKVYGYEALTEKAEGLSKDNDDNILFKLNAAGDVKVVYFWEEVATDDWKMTFKLLGDFYVEPTPVDAKYYVTGDSALVTDAGFAGKAWNPAAIKAEADTLVLNLKAEQVYKLKVTLDGTWNDGKVKGFNDLTEKPEGVTMDNDENIIFSLAEAGAVKVIYIAGETPIFKLIGNFYVDPTPVDPTVAVKGSMNNWGDSIPFVLAQDKKSASLTANIKKGNYEFKMIINGEWRSNGYTYHRDFPGCAGITANVEANMVLQLDVDGDYTFTWNFENDSLGIVFPNKPIPVLENGYYLVGDKYDWTPAATRMFVENTSAAGEYILADITLAADDSLKVVKVEDDEIITWYPGGDNYVVDAAHAGVKTIYFRPDGQGGEDWYAGCIYVAPNEMTAITNVNADAKAVKSLKNGILMIEKNGKVYNVIGLQIR